MVDLVRLKDTLKRHEGVKNKLYHDSLGIPTIGVGRNLERWLSDDEVDHLLNNDIRDALLSATRIFDRFNKLSDVRREVIVNMIFNLGESRFRGFKKMIMAVELGDFKKASIEMLDSRWAKQVGNRATELSSMMRGG